FPAFDPSGKYLYFTASTDIGPTTNGIDMSGMNRPVTRSVYLVVLDKDLPSPLSPESDDEKDKPADKDADKAKTEKDKKEALTKIDLENIGQRILALPLPARNYIGLHAGKAGIVLLLERPIMPLPMPLPTPGQGPSGDITVQKFDLNTRKTDKILDGISAFELSANGEKILHRQGDKWSITAVPSAAPG